jgi:ribose transport system substrate-binding protein
MQGTPVASPRASPGASPVASPAAAAEAGERMVRILDPDDLPVGTRLPARIGHVTNYLAHDWYQRETQAEQARADEYGIAFTVADANLDVSRSVASIDEVVAQQIDVLIFSPIFERAAGPAVRRVRESGIPVICEGVTTDGCTTLIAIDDYRAGFQLGEWAGIYVRDNLGGIANVLSVESQAVSLSGARTRGFIDGLKSIVATAELAQAVDGSGTRDASAQAAGAALQARPDINVILGVNDAAALGGLDAYQAAGMDTSRLLVVGFGCESNACKDELTAGGPFKASLAMFPEYQGRLTIDAAVVAYNGQALPVQIAAPTLPLTAANLSAYYTKQGDVYVANLEAIAALPVGSSA